MQSVERPMIGCPSWVVCILSSSIPKFGMIRALPDLAVIQKWNRRGLRQIACHVKLRATHFVAGALIDSQ